jgi:hypothetical protein
MQARFLSKQEFRKERRMEQMKQRYASGFKLLKNIYTLVCVWAMRQIKNCRDLSSTAAQINTVHNICIIVVTDRVGVVMIDAP